jgi:hypothetical protein
MKIVGIYFVIKVVIHERKYFAEKDVAFGHNIAFSQSLFRVHASVKFCCPVQ